MLASGLAKISYIPVSKGRERERELIFNEKRSVYYKTHLRSLE